MENSYGSWECMLLENQLDKILQAKKVSPPNIELPKENSNDELLKRDDNFIKVCVPEEQAVKRIQEYQSYIYRCRVCLYKTHTRVKVKSKISDEPITQIYTCKKCLAKKKG